MCRISLFVCFARALEVSCIFSSFSVGGLLGDGVSVQT
jgi:hypothetical protein